MQNTIALLLLSSSLLTSTQVYALSVDDTSMNGSARSERFSDPDEKSPVSTHMQFNGSANGKSDPNTVRYDYDSSSGTYVPHTNRQ